jgi:hypothetical protein
MPAKPWADTLFILMPIPGQPGAPFCSNFGVMSVAMEMANVRNALLRGLNSIYLQAPLAKDGGESDGLMDPNIDQHHAFEGKILKTMKWVEEVRQGREDFDS